MSRPKGERDAEWGRRHVARSTVAYLREHVETNRGQPDVVWCDDRLSVEETMLDAAKVIEALLARLEEPDVPEGEAETAADRGVESLMERIRAFPGVLWAKLEANPDHDGCFPYIVVVETENSRASAAWEYAVHEHGQTAQEALTLALGSLRDTTRVSAVPEPEEGEMDLAEDFCPACNKEVSPGHHLVCPKGTNGTSRAPTATREPNEREDVMEKKVLAPTYSPSGDPTGHVMKAAPQDGEREDGGTRASELWELLDMVKAALAVHLGKESMDRTPPMMYAEAIHEIARLTSSPTKPILHERTEDGGWICCCGDHLSPSEPPKGDGS